MKKIIGIDLGGTSIKMAIVSIEGNVLQKWSIPTNILDNGQHIVSDIIQSIKEQLDMQQIEWSEVLGIGMGTPGQVDFKNGTVIGAYNLGWSQEQLLKEQFEQVFPVPFFVDNDANVAALGEQWQGAGCNASDVVMVTLGTGVGGGVIIDGKLVHGDKGIAGEIGHIQVERDGFSCTCGLTGCLETVASATGIVNLARRQSKGSHMVSPLKDLVNDGVADAKVIFDMAKDGDAFAISVVDEFALNLGLACANIAHLLNPSYIVIGGGVSAAGDYLLDKVNNVFLKHTLPLVKDSTQLALATLGNDAGIIGAASLVLQ